MDRIQIDFYIATKTEPMLRIETAEPHLPMVGDLVTIGSHVNTFRVANRHFIYSETQKELQRVRYDLGPAT